LSRLEGAAVRRRIEHQKADLGPTMVLIAALGDPIQLVERLSRQPQFDGFGERNKIPAGVVELGRSPRGARITAAVVGMAALGIALAFFPAKQITSVWKYEAKMFGFTLFFLALAAFFFFVYGRQKAPQAAPVAART